MSLFRGEKLTVALCPEQLGIILRARRAGTLHELVPCASDGRRAWQVAVEALENWLATANVQRMRISIVLSNRFTRYVLLPWQNSYLTHEEEYAWMRVHFEAVYGDMEGWHITADPGRYGQTRIACAVPDELVTRIRILGAARRLTGGALVPYFVHSWNRWRGPGRTKELFGVAESEALVVGCHGPKGWESLRLLLTQPTPGELSVMAAREAVLQGLPLGSRPRLHVPGSVCDAHTEVQQNATVSWLALGTKREAPALAMARLVDTP